MHGVQQKMPTPVYASPSAADLGKSMTDLPKSGVKLRKSAASGPALQFFI
jgi:hypothetical protein